jgi:hypothetical protein
MSVDVYDLAKKQVQTADDDLLIMGQLSQHAFSSIMYPPFFEKANDLPKLVWKKCKFEMKNRDTLPKKQGVYVFAIEIDHPCLPQNCYILYVGKAGDLKSNNTIWHRYHDYIRYQKRNIRPRIREMLNMWKDHLVYFHAEVDPSTSTGDVEKMLTTIFLPPYNTADFTGEVADLLKGAGLL